MKIYTCEQVANGHSDKICDQIADAIVTDCLKNDKDSRVAIECLIKDTHIVIAGELTSKHEPNYYRLVDEVMKRIGNDDVVVLDEALNCHSAVLVVFQAVGHNGVCDLVAELVRVAVCHLLTSVNLHVRVPP